jgi:hypothetical protein
VIVPSELEDGMRLSGRACASVVLTILLLPVSALSALAASSQHSASSDAGSSASVPSGPVQPEDQVARHHVVYLTTRSDTMRQMLAVLDATPGVSIRLRSSHNGVQGMSSQRAHGVLRIDGASIRALLEFDTRLATLAEQFEMVAHEIAHVVEVACLPPTATGIERALLGRGFNMRQPGQRTNRLETPFPIGVGRAVVSEALARHTGAGKLRALARQYGLAPRCEEE